MPKSDIGIHTHTHIIGKGKKWQELEKDKKKSKGNKMCVLGFIMGIKGYISKEKKPNL